MKAPKSSLKEEAEDDYFHYFFSFVGGVFFGFSSIFNLSSK
jgi:hypothetical protein